MHQTLLLLLSLTLIYCNTNIWIQNNTPFNFSFSAQQHGEPLPRDKYEFHTSTILHGSRFKLGWFTRNTTDIKPNKEYLFSQSTDFPFLGEVKLEQKVVGGESNNVLFRKLGGVFNSEWVSERQMRNSTRGKLSIFHRVIGQSEDVEYTLWSPQYELQPGFNVISYNLYMRPKWLFKDGQMQRAAVIPRYLQGLDVIIFQEAFDQEARALLIAGIVQYGYKYYTPNVGKAGMLTTDGGVFIASRWPIVTWKNITYGKNCSGTDCLADKGCMYAKIQKGNTFYHVFGTHLNAAGEFSVKVAQLHMMRAFVDSLNIPADEPVILGGDFNVNLYSPNEFKQMLQILRAAHPRLVRHMFSSDGLLCTMKENTNRKYIDWIFYDVNHKRPREDSFHEAVVFKSMVPWVHENAWKGEYWDLSDHFPVYANLKFD